MQIAKSRRTLRINLGAAEPARRGKRKEDLPARNREVENLEMPRDSCGTRRLIYLMPPIPIPFLIAHLSTISGNRRERDILRVQRRGTRLYYRFYLDSFRV